MEKCSTDSDSLQVFIDRQRHLNNMPEGQWWRCQSMLINYGHGIKGTRLELHLKSLETLHRTITRLLEYCVPVLKEELSDCQRSKNPSKAKQKGSIGESKRENIEYGSGLQICGGCPPLGEEPEPKELS